MYVTAALPASLELFRSTNAGKISERAGTWKACGRSSRGRSERKRPRARAYSARAEWNGTERNPLYNTLIESSARTLPSSSHAENGAFVELSESLRKAQEARKASFSELSSRGFLVKRCAIYKQRKEQGDRVTVCRTKEMILMRLTVLRARPRVSHSRQLGEARGDAPGRGRDEAEGDE